jgi:hypothetical protein
VHCASTAKPASALSRISPAKPARTCRSSASRHSRVVEPTESLNRPHRALRIDREASVSAVADIPGEAGADVWESSLAGLPRCRADGITESASSCTAHRPRSQRQRCREYPRRSRCGREGFQLRRTPRPVRCRDEPMDELAVHATRAAMGPPSVIRTRNHADTAGRVPTDRCSGVDHGMTATIPTVGRQECLPHHTPRSRSANPDASATRTTARRVPTDRFPGVDHGIVATIPTMGSSAKLDSLTSASADDERRASCLVVCELPGTALGWP